MKVIEAINVFLVQGGILIVVLLILAMKIK